MTSMPTWAVWALAFGTPVLAFAGGAIGQVITWQGTRDLEHRSKREEVMRVLRWAAELGIAAEEPRARLGRSELEALLDSELLDEEERDFVQAALEATLAGPVQQIERAGENVRAVVSTGPAAEQGIPSKAAAHAEEGGS
ncbi:MAG TPA: hypothetical protein VH637_11485 [Streptosporangiaceae bacterium]|jgi:hypothetical protein